MQEKNVDLFFGSMVDVPLRDDRALMEYPFFSLQKQPQMTALEYDDGKVKIRVAPGEKGIATIWDKDILIYCATFINDRIEKGQPIERKIFCTSYDILATIGRAKGKKNYEQLYDALYRLRSTTITTDIKSGDKIERRGFGMIDSFRIVEREIRGVPMAIGLEITLNEWMYRALAQDRRVLSINRAYFDLTMGLERRLYELARKHCGHQPEWRIGLERLAEKCGSRNSLRRFKLDLKRVIERNNIPDYVYVLANDHNGEGAKAAAEIGAKYPKGASRRKNDLVMVVVLPRVQKQLES